MLPQKIFKNLHAVVAILILLNNFGQVLFKFFAHKSEFFTKYDAFFCIRIFYYACLGRIVIER